MLRLRRKRSQKRKLKPIWRVLFFFTTFILFCNFIDSRVKMLPLSVVETVAQNFCAQVISNAVMENSENISMISDIVYKNSSETALIDQNAKEINVLKSSILSDINNNLNGGHNTYIPIGNLFDNTFLNGRGFKIPIKLYFNGSADISIESEIVSAGVNQSKYRITMTVNTEIYSNSLSYDGCFYYESDYVLSEFLILGEVPLIGTT